MKCAYCGGKGYVESHHMASATINAMLRQCPEKCNISAYSNRVQELLTRQRLPERKTSVFVETTYEAAKVPCKIIPFPRKT